MSEERKAVINDKVDGAEAADQNNPVSLLLPSDKNTSISSKNLFLPFSSFFYSISIFFILFRLLRLSEAAATQC